MGGGVGYVCAAGGVGVVVAAGGEDVDFACWCWCQYGLGWDGNGWEG